MREAPEAVVAAVQEAAIAHQQTTCMDHWDRCCCRCERHNMSSMEARAHAAQVAADAAWAAAYPAALRDAAELFDDFFLDGAPGPMLRRWADESEAP